MTSRRTISALFIALVATLPALAACGTSQSDTATPATADPVAETVASLAPDTTIATTTVAPTAPPTAAPTTAAPTTAAPATVPPPITTVAPIVVPPQPMMPNVVCMNLQDAQDYIQTFGVFLSLSEDATGAGRNQLIDSNWQVVAQYPEPGTPFGEGDATLFVVKYGEQPNPC